VGIQGILMGDLEKQLSLKIRTIFEDRNRDRLFFTIREVSHAWVDIFVEAFKPTLGDRGGYLLGHLVAYFLGVVCLAGVGGLAGLVLVLIQG